MFKLVNSILIAACAIVWLWILATPAIKYEDKVCPPQAKPVRYPDGMRVPVCNPTGIVWQVSK